MESRLATDPDLSRGTLSSGDPSRDSEIADRVGLPRVRELARSATDGERDGSRVLDFRTAKNVEDGTLLRGGGASLSPEEPESFSRALMRCEMLDPSLPLLARFFWWLDVCCWVILCKKAAPEDTDRAEL